MRVKNIVGLNTFYVNVQLNLTKARTYREGSLNTFYVNVQHIEKGKYKT